MNLLRSVSLLALLCTAISAHAVVLTLDSYDLVVTRPTSGSLTFYLTGTFQLEPGEKADTLTCVGLSNPAAPWEFLYGRFPDEIYYALIDTPAGGSYSGKLYSYTIKSTTAFGTYLDAGSLPYYQVSGHLNGAVTSDLKRFSVNIVPVPEPASLCALGLGAAALIRRRAVRK